MRAVDTNVVLRLLVGDDAEQEAAARACFDEPVLITISVLIETGWVLRSRYGFRRAHICTLLSSLSDYRTVTVERSGVVGWALGRFGTSGDLADLLHIAAAAEASAFVTFDRAIPDEAGPDTPIPIQLLA